MFALNPVVGGAKSSALQFSSLEADTLATSTSFDAANFDTNNTNVGTYFIPPDPHGAVGPNHVLNVVNVSIQWFTKEGTRQHNQSLKNFFAPAGAVNFLFDPKVVYDEHAARFFVVALERTDVLDGANSDTSRILVAVSDDSDPNGTWHFQAINGKININGTNSWADYPGLAVDEQAVYITNNMFGFRTTGRSYLGSRLWIVPKGDGAGGLYDGGTAAVNVFDPSKLAGNGWNYFTLQPTHIRGAGGNGAADGAWLVSSDVFFGNQGFEEGVAVVRIQNPLSTSPTFTRWNFNLGDISSTNNPPDVPQKDTNTKIDAGDLRMFDAEWRNGNIYAVNQIVPNSGPDAGQVTARWYRISTAGVDPAVQDQGNIGAEDIAAGTHTYYPSVTVDASENVAFGFAASGANLYGGAYYTMRAASDAAGTVQSTGTLKAGEDYYIRAFGGTRNRWGDYSAIDIDPSAANTFWVYNEYAMTRGTVFGGEDGRWGTMWGKFSIATNQAPSVALTNKVTALNENADASVRRKVADIVLTDDGIGANDFHVSGADAAMFEIVGSALYLKAGELLDFETNPVLNVTVEVDDAGVGGNPDSTAELAINIGDVNEAPTALLLSNNSVDENKASGSAVGTFSTLDPEGGSFTYTLIAGTGSDDNASFAVDGGVLQTAASFNYEVKNEYTIRVETKDGDGLTKEAVFVIGINNVNEDPANLLLSNSSIDENKPSGSLVGTFSTSDPDAGDTFEYRLVAGTGDINNNSFTVNLTTGELQTSASFNYELKSSYSIRVQTEDAGGRTREEAFTISVNNVNEAPTALLLSNNAVDENKASGIVIGSFSTSDPDAGGSFTYVFVDGENDNALFTIDGGELGTAASLNYEAKNSYSIRVRTTDGGGLSTEQDLTINVVNVNEQPTALVLSNNSVDENQASGAVVGAFSTLDPEGGSFTYTLIAGTGSDDNASFTIVDAELQTAASFNYEAKDEYTIRVETKDGGNLTREAVFAISINDINEAPDGLTLSNSSLEENLAGGTTVGTIAATDPDAGDGLQYLLVAGTGDDDNGSFALDPQTGLLTTVGSFDYESQSSYSIRVRATDAGELSTELVFSISVIDVNEAPVLDNALSPTLTTIAEDGDPLATGVASLLSGAVTDPDANALQGIAVTTASNFNGVWQFSLDGSTWEAMGSVSRTSALLLPGSAWVRFVPNANFNGQVGLYYRAWDQTQGSPGGMLNARLSLGGVNSLSIAPESASLTVTAVNDAPQLNTALEPVLNSIWEDAKTPSGTFVSSLVQGAISDVDAGAWQGIAVVYAANNGTWEYLLSGSQTWLPMGILGETSALLLAADAGTRVRMIPNPNFNGTVRLYYRAWDRTQGTPGNKVSLSGKLGGSHAFSAEVESAPMAVTAVNDRPAVTFSSAADYRLNKAAIILSPFARVRDVDSSDFDGGRLLVRIDSGASASNRLGIGSRFTVDASNNVRYDGVIIGQRNVNGGVGTNDLIVTFNSNALLPIVKELVRAITFKTVGGSAGIRKAVFSLSDGDGGTSLDITKTISVM